MKNKKHILQQVLSLFLLLLLVQNAAAQEKKHMIWEVSSARGDKVYLLGSIHLAKKDLYPLDSLYYQVFEEADILGFEVNIDSMMQQSQKLLTKYGFYPDGESLQDHLPKETFDMIRNYFDSLGMPMGMMAQMKPWVVASSLSALELQKAAYSTAGIDQHFYNKAKKENKTIMALETAEFQIKLFAEMPEEVQIEYLKYSLKQGRKTVSSIDSITNLWKEGNAKKLNQLLEGEMEKYSKEMHNKLLINRNKNWSKQIKKFIENGKKAVFIVGSGHLVGEKSLNELLQNEGYKVKQL